MPASSLYAVMKMSGGNMYAWKCWRDSRTFVRLVLILPAGFLAIALFGKAPHFPNTLPVQTSQAREVVVWMQSSRIMLYFLAIFASMINADGFLLSRPIARWRLVWIPLGIALLEFAAIWTITGCIGWLYVLRVPRSLVFPSQSTLPLYSVIPVLVGTYLVSALLARSAMTLALLLIQRRRRLFYWLVLAGTFSVYLALSTIFTSTLHILGPSLPTLIPPILISHGMSMAYEPDLAWQLASRVALVLVFTFLTQKELERREI